LSLSKDSKSWLLLIRLFEQELDLEHRGLGESFY
jgi:hypothetical protein